MPLAKVLRKERITMKIKVECLVRGEVILKANSKNEKEALENYYFGVLKNVKFLDNGFAEGTYTFDVEATTKEEARIYARGVYEILEGTRKLDVGDLHNPHLGEYDDGSQFRVAE